MRALRKLSIVPGESQHFMLFSNGMFQNKVGFCLFF
jgi:hypothetical protein